MINTAASKMEKAQKAMISLSDKTMRPDIKNPSNKNVEGIFLHNRIVKSVGLFENEGW